LKRKSSLSFSNNSIFSNQAMYVMAVYLLCNIAKYSPLIDAGHGAFANIVSIEEKDQQPILSSGEKVYHARYSK